MLKERQAAYSNSGFSYTEVLLAVTLIAISLVPVLNSFKTAVLGVSGGAAGEIDRLLINEKMEEVLTVPFGDLSSEVNGLGKKTVYSDNGFVNTGDGRKIKRFVYIADYAPEQVNHFNGGDGKILFIRVRIRKSEQKLETLINEF